MKKKDAKKRTASGSGASKNKRSKAGPSWGEKVGVGAVRVWLRTASAIAAQEAGR